jgi:hypothetical protein
MKNLINSVATVLILLGVGFYFLSTPHKVRVVKSLEVLLNTDEGKLTNLVFPSDSGAGGNPSIENVGSLSDHSPEAKAYFREIALGNEFSNKISSTPYRWTKNMKIYVYGYRSPMMMDELNRIVKELNDIINPITISVVSNRNDANFIIYLGSYKTFAANHPDIHAERLVNNWGYFQIYNNEGLMYVDVIRAKEENAQKHLLREELTQSLGLCNDSYKYDNSIFYQGWTTTTEYAPIDRELIDMLYN